MPGVCGSLLLLILISFLFLHGAYWGHRCHLEIPGVQASLPAGQCRAGSCSARCPLAPRSLLTPVPFGGFISGLFVAAFFFNTSIGGVGTHGRIGSSGLDPPLLTGILKPTPELAAGLGLISYPCLKPSTSVPTPGFFFPPWLNSTHPCLHALAFPLFSLLSSTLISPGMLFGRSQTCATWEAPVIAWICFMFSKGSKKKKNTRGESEAWRGVS